MAPPKVRFTTSGGGASLHPFFYTNGTVSLSISGTYAGPQWSSTQSLSSLLLSIQSLLTERPCYEQPFKRHTNKQDDRKEAEDYNTFVRYEVIKESVCGTVERRLQGNYSYPPALQRKVLKLFLENYANYERCVNQDNNLSGTPIKNPFSGGLGMYDHEALAGRLRNLKTNVETRIQSNDLGAVF
ncbi:ubiquitin-conjugating enzyme E2 Z-like [Rhipicephalus sanguineus]|uniref:ubiquitin-conjugating enzyme E2 Z-like n=1 Tax=Rhipicephalus sanguineus TaxID=34632 RepID=UPI00189473D8|nr:ubiquitin-conjugating enzyme E2 Z-like [Rhipicephalus sanguineus]